MITRLTSATVNKHIKHTGLKLVRYKAGYCTWYSTRTGSQVGDSVMVYSVSQLPLERWVRDAETHAKQHPEQI